MLNSATAAALLYASLLSGCIVGARGAPHGRTTTNKVYAQAGPCAGSPSVARGVLDPSFGSGGIAVGGYGGRFDTGAALGLAQDCGLLVAGSSGTSSPDGTAYAVGLLRLNPDGSPDSSFASGGSATFDLGSAQDEAAGLALQPDGKILVAGRTALPGGSAFALLRFDTDGTLDGGFGTGGRVVTSFPEGGARARAVAVQQDGRIVVAGTVSGVSGFSSRSAVALVRYTADGALDPSFGAGGRVITTVADGASAVTAGIAVDSGGRLVVAASLRTDETTSFAVLRYQPDGTLDPAFGTDGWTATSFDGEAAAAALALQADGRIVVAGRATTGVATQGDSVRIGGDRKTRFAVARYQPDGQADPSFGAGGTAAFLVDGRDAAATAVAIQGDGGIVVAGSTVSNSNSDVALARLTAAGQPDSSFGNGGYVVTDASGGPDQAQALVIQPDGAIVVAGSAYMAYGPTRVVVVRYQ